MSSIIRRLEADTEAGARLCAAVDREGGFLAAEAERNDADGAFAAASVRRLQEAGVLAACAPVEHGGGGLVSLRDLTLLVSRIAEYDASLATAVSMHLTLAWYYGRTVRTGAAADTALEAGWLAATGREGMVVASTVAEPGREAWRVETTARRDGAGWTVSGRKAMVSLSPVATHLYTRLKVETADGPALGSAMVPVRSAGVTVLDDWDGLGLRGSGSGRVVLDGVRLPAGAVRLRGPWGVRDEGAFEGRAASSTPLAGVYLGIAEAAAECAFREAAGSGARSAGSQALLAELRLALAALRGTLHTALTELHAGLAWRAPRGIGPDEGSALLESCVLASMVTERGAGTVVDLAMQVCGGRSFRAGHQLGRLYRDVRAASFMRPYAPAEEWVDFAARTAAPRKDG